MGAVDTTYTFTATDTITSAKMNNIIDQTTMTSDACLSSGGLIVSSGQLAIGSGAINSSRLANSAVTNDTIADSTITEPKLAVGARVPAGAIMAFAMNVAPTGWAAADGASVNTTGIYAALFAAIGYTYGGSGGSFNLPDLRGYFVRGFGVNVDGTTSNSSFGEKKADTLQNITGTVATFANGNLGGNWHVEPQNANGAFYNTSSGGSMTTGGGGAGAGYVNVVFDASRVARTSTETAPRNISMLYCIKL